MVAAGCRGAALGQEALHLGLRHGDAVDHLFLAQLGDAHLVADVVAKVLEAAAVGDDRLAHLTQRHLVALGDVLQGEVQLVVADVDPRLVGQLHLQTAKDEVIEHLALELAARRHRRTAPLQVEKCVEFRARVRSRR